MEVYNFIYYLCWGVFFLIAVGVILKRKKQDNMYSEMMARQKEAVELLREIRDLLKKNN